MVNDITPNIFPEDPAKNAANASVPLFVPNQAQAILPTKVEIEIDAGEDDLKTKEQASIPQVQVPNLTDQKPLETQTQEKTPTLIVQNLAPNEKFLSVIAYFDLLVFVPIASQPKNEYVQFHTKQGVIVTILDWAILIALIVPNLVLPRILGSLLFGLVFFTLLVAHLFLAYKAFTGTKFEIPLISEIAKKINLAKLEPTQYVNKFLQSSDQKPSTTSTTATPQNQPSNLNQDEK
jgi:uncharacterized membrane protein